MPIVAADPPANRPPGWQAYRRPRPSPNASLPAAPLPRQQWPARWLEQRRPAGRERLRQVSNRSCRNRRAPCLRSLPRHRRRRDWWSRDRWSLDRSAPARAPATGSRAVGRGQAARGGVLERRTTWSPAAAEKAAPATKSAANTKAIARRRRRDRGVSRPVAGTAASVTSLSSRSSHSSQARRLHRRLIKEFRGGIAFSLRFGRASRPPFRRGFF